MITIKILSGNVKDNPTKKTLLIQMECDAPSTDCAVMRNFIEQRANVGDVLKNRSFEKLQWVVSYNDTALRGKFIGLLQATFKDLVLPDLSQNPASSVASPKMLLMSVKIGDTPTVKYSEGLDFDVRSVDEKIQAQVKTLENEKNELADALAASQEEVERQKKQIVALQAASDEKDQQNAALKLELTKEQGAVANLKRELDAQATLLKEKNERIQKFSDEVIKLNQCVAEKTEIIEKLQQQLMQAPTKQDLSIELRIRKEEIDAINQKLLDITVEKTVLQTEQEKQKQDYQQKIKEFQTKLDQLQAKQESLRVPIVSTRPLSSQSPSSKGKSESEEEAAMSLLTDESLDNDEKSDSDSDSESEAETNREMTKAPTSKKMTNESLDNDEKLDCEKNRVANGSHAMFREVAVRSLFKAILYNEKVGANHKTIIWDFYKKVNIFLFSELPKEYNGKRPRWVIIYGIGAMITFAKQIEKYKQKRAQLDNLLAEYSSTQLINHESSSCKIYLFMLIQYSLIVLDQKLISCLAVRGNKKISCSMSQTRGVAYILCTLGVWIRSSRNAQYVTISQNEMLDLFFILADFVFNMTVTEQTLRQTLLDYANTRKLTLTLDCLQNFVKEMSSCLSAHQADIKRFIDDCKPKPHEKMFVPRAVIDLQTCTVREDVIPRSLCVTQNTSLANLEFTDYYPVGIDATDECMVPASSSSSSSSASAQPKRKKPHDGMGCDEEQPPLKRPSFLRGSEPCDAKSSDDLYFSASNPCDSDKLLLPLGLHEDDFDGNPINFLSRSPSSRRERLEPLFFHVSSDFFRVPSESGLERQILTTGNDENTALADNDTSMSHD